MSESIALSMADICGLSVVGVCYLWVFFCCSLQFDEKVPKNRNTSDWKN